MLSAPRGLKEWMGRGLRRVESFILGNTARKGRGRYLGSGPQIPHASSLLRFTMKNTKYTNTRLKVCVSPPDPTMSTAFRGTASSQSYLRGVSFNPTEKQPVKCLLCSTSKVLPLLSWKLYGFFQKVLMPRGGLGAGRKESLALWPAL